MSEVEASEKRLEHAFARLETALVAALAAPDGAPPPGAASAQVENGETLRDISARLDQAIHRLRRVLED